VETAVRLACGAGGIVLTGNAFFGARVGALPPAPRCAVTFLRARRVAATSGFWTALAADHAGAPMALQELACGDASVVCDPSEATASLTWAQRHSVWLDDPAPVWIATE
jgi:hypothetical protein